VNPATVSALALLLAMFASSAIGYGSGDGDLWWQRQLGEAVLRTHALPRMLGSATFSAPDARWVAHEWVFATLWALANRYGADAVFRIACAAVALLTFVAEALRARRAAPPAQMVMLVLVGFAVTPSFGLRAQILGWPLLAFIMLALEAGPRRAWFALPLAVVWYNVHASAIVVPCIVAVYAAGIALETRRIRPALPYVALAAACAAASLATPFGSELPRFAVAWSSNAATGLIYEWLPAAPDKILILDGVLAIALLLMLGEVRGVRLTWPQRLLAAGLFAATMLHIRNLGLFAIVAGPWSAAALTTLLPHGLRGMRSAVAHWRTGRGIAALACCGALALVVLRLRVPLAVAPADSAAARLRALHAPLRVACEDFSWCSRFAADAGVRVLLDGRTDAYPPAVFADYRRMLRGDALPVFARWRVDAAVVHAHGPLADALRAAGWTLLRSREPQVYVRPARTGREQAAFERFGGVLPRRLGRAALDERAAEAREDAAVDGFESLRLGSERRLADVAGEQSISIQPFGAAQVRDR
jgi:hypothetical protein